MKSIFFRIAVAATLCSTLLLIRTGFADEEDVYIPSPSAYYFWVTTFDEREVKDAFHEQGGEKDAWLFWMNLTYGSPQVPERKAKLTRVAFDVTYIEGMQPQHAGEMRLVMDMNGNKHPDEDDLVVGTSFIDFAEKKIIFTTDMVVNTNVQYNLFLVGDFLHLENGMEIRIKFYERLLAGYEEESNKTIQVLYGGYQETWHREGNTPPEIRYASERDSRFGVNPLIGRSGDMFTFELMYTDRDGDMPVRVEVWIDLNDDGNFSEDERFPMHPKSDHEGTKYARYITGRAIIPRESGKIAYRFFATDGKDDATGAATEVRQFNILIALIIQPGEMNNRMIVPGERFDVTYQVQYFFDHVRIDWGSVARMDFSPFTLEAMIHKDRKAMNLIYDQEKLVLRLQAPANMRQSHAAIPQFVVRSVWWDVSEQKERILEGVAQSGEIVFVPLKAERIMTPLRIVPTIGDEIRMTLVITKRPDVELISDPAGEFNFLPFTALRPPVFSEARNGEIDVLRFTADARAFIPTGAEARSYEFAPYALEYHIRNEEENRILNIPKAEVVFSPVLTKNELQGPLLVFPRVNIENDWFIPFFREVYVVVYVCWFTALAAATALLWKPVRFAYSAAWGSRRWRAFAARREWIIMQHRYGARGVIMWPGAAASLERSFRRYMSYVLGCTEVEAQSAAIYTHLAACPWLNEGTRILVRSCLEAFIRIDEMRIDDEEIDTLLNLQKKLKSLLRVHG